MTGLIPLLALAILLLMLLLAGGVILMMMRPPRKTYSVALARNLATHPSELGRQSRDLNLRLANNHTSPAWLVEGDDPEGPLIVVVHGFGDSRYGALTRLDLLAPYAAQLLFYDQRGHGESNAPNSHAGATEARDLLAILEQLQPDRPVVLFGYSMGAGVAIVAASSHPLPSRERAGVRGNPSSSDSYHIAGVIADGPYRLWHQPLSAMLRRRRYPTWPTLALVAGILHLTGPHLRRFDRLQYTRQLQVPLLVLHGSDDPLCPLEGARQIAQAAPQGRFVLFEGGRHLDLLEIDPDKYRHALDEFFHQLKETPLADHQQSNTHLNEPRP